MIERNGVAGVVVALAAGGMLAGLTACGGSSVHLEPRYVAVHNTMTAMGLAQTGAINEGSLPEGGVARSTQHLEAGQCTTYVALGGESVDDLDVRVQDDAGTALASDATHDRHAAVRVCPDYAGDYQVVLTMAGGHGEYTLSAWSGVASSGGAAVTAREPGRGAGGRGSCAAPLPLELGRPVQGDTRAGASNMSGSCAEGNAAEQVYQLRVESRSQVTAVLQSTFDGALYLQRECGQRASELGCNDDNPDTTRSQLDLTLDPGTYFLVVDGYEDAGGTYELVVSAAAAQPIEALCSDAAPLAFGRAVTGTTVGAQDAFTATCAGGAHSPDRVYRVDVPSRARLRIKMRSDHDGALYLRSDCTNPSSELACNDDFGDQQHSLVTAVVDPGHYFVYADGYNLAASGAFTLEAEMAPEAGGGATGDQCTAAAAAVLGTPTAVDTFSAADDLSGSCGGQGAPDVVQRIDVRARSRVRVSFTGAEHSGVAYLQRTCGDTTTELGCVAFAPAGNAGAGPGPGPGPRPGPMPMPTPPPGSAPVTPALDVTVDPGTYYLVIDGARAGQFGAVQVNVQLEDIAALERTCRQAPVLRVGQTVSGSTAASTDRFQASCADGAASPDELYRITLTRRSIVKLSLASDYDAALYIRRDCTQQSTELACNDDSTDNRHSYVETTLDRGTYYVIVDGFRTGNQGTFRLDYQVQNAP
jgi:hypothetical protein